MTEQSQMPLVSSPKRRGWAEIFWLRPLTASTYATLVVTRRGRLASILPAGGPRVLSDYLAWPYDFREVDTRERLLTLDQRLESFDSSYEFLVSLRLIYQVVRPDRVALELDDVSTELTLAVVQSLRLSARSFGVEQDKTFEEHLQETLITNDALAQRAQLLGLVLHRVDVIVTLDEPTRAHAEALRFAMRERPLHFQIAIESLEPDRSFDVHVGGVYRLTERRAQDEPSDVIDSAIQTAVTRALRRIGITFEPSDYSNAAKAMAEVLRKDVLFQSELAMVHAQLLRPTVQIQPDRSMVHVPRPTVLGVPEIRPDQVLRRSRQGLPRLGRPPALEDMQERAPQRALSPPEAQPTENAARWAVSPEAPLPEMATSPTLPLDELPAPGEPIEGDYTRWSLREAMPTMRALPTPGQPDDESDGRAPWADLIRGTDDQADDLPWSAAPSASLNTPVESLPWENLATEGEEQRLPWEQTPAWLADPPAPLSTPVEPLPWEHSGMDAPKDSDVGQPAFGAAFAPDEAENDIHAISEPAIAPPAPIFLDSEPAEDLGFVLDWSEPEAAPVIDPAADELVPMDTAIAEDLGFSLDWSEPAIDSHTDLPLLSVDTIADNSVITAEWDDRVARAPWNEQDIAVPELTRLDEAQTLAEDSPGAVTLNLDRWATVDLDSVPSDPQPTQPERSPAMLEQDAQQDETLAFAEQGVPPWYAPTLHFDAQLPFDPSADAPYASLEAFGTAWSDAPTMGEPGVEVAAETPADAPPAEPDVEVAVETPIDAPLEVFGAAWADAPTTGEPGVEVVAETPIDAPLEVFGAAWADAPTTGEPAVDAMAADAVTQAPDEVLGAGLAIETASAQSPADANEQILVHAETATDVSAELIARLIGMIQSYGPAWFKMWSLELKERPERLPVVLGEVTADPVLLAQADDPRVQAALLAALAVYTSLPVYPARLQAAAPLPSPVMASQSNDDQDEVPDWLSLRVKWNGHGGGA